MFYLWTKGDTSSIVIDLLTRRRCVTYPTVTLQMLLASKILMKVSSHTNNHAEVSSVNTFTQAAYTEENNILFSLNGYLLQFELLFKLFYIFSFLSVT